MNGIHLSISIFYLLELTKMALVKQIAGDDQCFKS